MITEEKERDEELQNRILEVFASTVSHDLRNPLNVAGRRLQLARETGDFEHLEPELIEAASDDGARFEVTGIEFVTE